MDLPYNTRTVALLSMADNGLSRLEATSIPRTPFPLLPLLLLMWPLSGQGSPISLAPERHRPAPGLGDGHGGVIDPSLLEQDSDMDMQSLLVNLRGQFLRTFNLSGLGPPAQPPGSARVEPPEYMMELYNRFANDRTAMPTANIIRSFKNEGREPLYCIGNPYPVLSSNDARWCSSLSFGEKNY